MAVRCTITRADESKDTIVLTAAIDTLDEVDYYRHGGILHHVLRQRLAAETAGSAD
jgi:aconitate hydratase